MAAFQFLGLCLVIVLMTSLRETDAHGRLIQPPSRSSCWRFGFPGCVANYNDNELFCGGVGKQWGENGGKCGVCGDNWADPQPRANEAGGRYGKGVIVGTYKRGSVLDVTVELTAAHLGWFEFRLCKNDDVTKIITHECLDQNLLKFTDGTTRYKIGHDGKKKHYLKLRLPQGLTCSQCVLQWKYNTGNTWGCEDGKCCTGCGPQEQFYGCADITIN